MTRLTGVVFFQTVPQQAFIDDRDLAPAKASNGVLHDQSRNRIRMR
jgi:hypothetical protein